MQMTDETVPTGDTTGTDTTASADTATTKDSATTDVSKEIPPGEKPSTDETTKPGDEAKTEDEKPPITYTDFVVPEGMALDKGLLDTFVPVLQKHSLPQEAVQELVDAYSKHMQSQMEGATEAFEQAYEEKRLADLNVANAKGMEDIKADPELGGKNYDVVRNRVIGAVAAVGSLELRQSFEKHGLGNDPAFVRFINRLIDYRPEDRGENPAGGGGAKQSHEQVLYGKT